MTTIKIEAETSLLKAEAPKQGNYYISDEGALYHLAVILGKAVLVNVKGGYLATPVPLTASPCISPKEWLAVAGGAYLTHVKNVTIKVTL